ncbi:MAG: GNAT family N-acetyltransferase [Kiloniellales bacterium]|nr:GNAT family N-acetyltransferase [Kiloniellales bacterium]
MTEAPQRIHGGTVAPAEGPPPREALAGRWVRLQPIDPARHVAELYAVSAEDPGIWTYMPYGPFPSQAAMTAWLNGCADGEDPLFYALIDAESGRAAGMASYLNIVPQHGSIEIGHIWFSELLRRRRAASEAIFLMIRQAFDGLGYRRVEWKCNARNAASRQAALRYGFAFEGVFHQHLIVKGANRDSAWFSILDGEWPALRGAFETWLDPDNFDAEGQQKESLSTLTAAARG